MKIHWKTLLMPLRQWKAAKSMTLKYPSHKTRLRDKLGLNPHFKWVIWLEPVWLRQSTLRNLQLLHRAVISKKKQMEYRRRHHLSYRKKKLYLLLKSKFSRIKISKVSLTAVWAHSKLESLRYKRNLQEWMNLVIIIQKLRPKEKRLKWWDRVWAKRDKVRFSVSR